MHMLERPITADSMYKLYGVEYGTIRDKARPETNMGGRRVNRETKGE